MSNLESNTPLPTQDLRDQLPALLSGSELLKRQAEEPLGLSTGDPELDRRLLWRGVPRGSLSLIVAPPGLGATSFWLEIARRNGEQKRWSLWLSQNNTLFAPALWNRGVCLKHLYVVRTPEKSRENQFALRECLESQVFTLIGCEVSSLRGLTRSLPKLRNLVEKSQAAFVFISNDPADLKRTHEMSWVMELRPDTRIIHKAKNRPSFSLPWRGSYAHLLSQLSQANTSVDRRGLSRIHPAAAVSRTGPAVWGRDEDPVAI